jgi:hypothetical protein
MSKRKIGWQKYEDAVEEQLTSPLIQLAINQAVPEFIKTEEEQEEEEAIAEDLAGGTHILQPMITLSPEMAADFAIASSFDCWYGHTNFNITPTMKDILDTVEGVEILKVCSRYRFFIGVGRMFNFGHVRKELEKLILK